MGVKWFAPLVFSAAFLVVGVGVTAYLADSFLTSPPGAFVYLLTAFPWDLVNFSTAVFSLTWRGRPSATVRAVQVVTIIGLSVGCVWYTPAVLGQFIYSHYHSDPIGSGDDVARGPCVSSRIASSENGAGLEAEVRQTECSGNWDGDLMYFVFVHRRGEPNAKKNLVFRYAADASTSTGPPTTAWKSNNRLLISAHGDIVSITYQMLDTKDISIAYDLSSDSRPMFPALSESVVR